MKKVLLISFYFPPHQNIGSRRPFGLAKYLPTFGWEPIVLTARLPGKPPESIKIIESDYKDIVTIIKSKVCFNSRKGLQEQLGIAVSKNYSYPTLRSKVIKFVKEIITFPDEQIGWYNYAITSASEFLNKQSVDAMISTSYPVTSHLIARKLKQKYKMPWVADLRDLWTQNHYVNKFGLIRYFERRLEIKTLSDADILVTANPQADVLKTLHKGKKIICITNGFDIGDFPETPVKLSDKFTITYTGILYNGKRDPSLLFNAVEQLIHEKRIERKLIEIRFFGCNEGWLIDEIEKYNLKGIVNIYGGVPREEVLKIQKESQILLLLLWDNKNEKSILPGKVFEYIGARRPIIAIGGAESVVKNLLEETNTGKYAENINILKDILLKYYEEFIQFREVKYKGNNTIEKYTHDSLAKKYSGILNEIISR